MALRALSSVRVQKVIVSTDADDIGAIAAREGAVYFKRSAETCQWNSPMVDAVLEVLEQEEPDRWDLVVVMYPVCPFVDPQEINQGFELAKRYPVVYPIYKAHEPPERSLIVNDGAVTPRYPEFTELNSQAIRQTYQSAGQWYIADVDWLKEYRTLTPHQAGYIEIPQERAFDIDTIDDWRAAELMYLMHRLPGFYDQAVRRMMGDIAVGGDGGESEPNRSDRPRALGGLL